jgi:hypothetical protein
MKMMRSRNSVFYLEANGYRWECRWPEAAGVAEQVQPGQWLLPGDVVFALNEGDMFVAPSNSRQHGNIYAKGELPGRQDKEQGNLDTFPIVGFTGVLTSLNGAGYVVLLEEFGAQAPTLTAHASGFEIRGAGRLRVVCFADGGYNRMAAVIRDWMREKGYYRRLLDKPFGEKLRGAVAVRPVQHGAISKRLWEQVAEVIPKAIMVWRAGEGTAAAGLEHFSVELQRELDRRGGYVFLPWCGMALGVGPEEQAAGNKRHSFDRMPQEMLDRYGYIVDGKPYYSEKGDGVLFHPSGLKERMAYWLYDKMPRHPNTYRTDGANIDTLDYWFKPNRFVPCDRPGAPADFRDQVQGYTEMARMVCERGGMVTHEGVAFFLEKYAFGGYGKPLVTLGSNAGFYLDDPGKPLDPDSVLKQITEQAPIHQLVYHDQLAMRLHDAESLNMRYGTPAKTERIRRYKLLYLALFGLTPNVQLGGEKADEWIAADLPWLRAEIPRAAATYSRTYGQAILAHNYLTDDRLVQECVYEDGTRITANFDSVPRKAQGRNDNVAELSYIIE